jgi:hypothetical protein
VTGSRRSSERHLLLCGPFPALEPRLFEEIELLQRADPLRAVTIVVASNLLGVHLRRRYVEWREARGLAPAHGGLMFSTLASFAEQAAGPGPPPLPAFGEFAILSDALARLPEARAFGDLAGRPAVVPSHEATIRDLADSDVAPKSLRAIVAASAPPGRRVLLGAVARLYEAVDRGTAGHETPWRVFRRAAAAKPSSADPVLLYGFYDATGVQKAYLEAIATRRPIRALVPRPPGRYGEFADAFLGWLAERLGTSAEAVDPEDCALADFHRRLGGAPGNGGPADGSVRLVSAASAAAERTEIAREILAASRDGVPLHAMGVIVRESNAWSGALARELARLGIPSFEYRAESAGSSTLGRAIRLWWELDERDFSREDVLAVFDLLGAAGTRDIGASARALARRAGIVRGAREWSEKLAGLANAPESGAEGRAAGALAGDCDRLISSARDWPLAALGWAQWSVEIARRLEILFAPDAVPAPLTCAAEALGPLADLGGEVGRDAAAHVFFGALDEQREMAGKLGKDGVFIGSAMAARGLTFPFVAVVDLVEREFPLPGRPDPLLFDAERRALAGLTGRPVPMKVAARPSEERQLFGMAAGSATERLVLTASRRDEALTRDRLPSPFFTDAERVANLGGAPPARATGLGAPVSEGPPVSEAEAHDRALTKWGAPTVAEVSAPFARALARQDLLRSPRWTAFEGRLGPEAREALAPHRPSAVASLSASRVAMFAACPYRYFLRNVQRLKEWEEPEREAELDPRSLGNAFHDAARRLVAAASKWPLTADDAERLATVCAEEALVRHEAEHAPIVPGLIREISLRRLEALLHAWLRHEAARGDGLRPVAAERPVGSREAPFVVDAGEFSVRFTGSIDRVDEDSDRRPARVIDYKVKLAPGFRKAFGEGRIAGGEAVQLPIYSLAAGGDVASEYLVLQAGNAGAPSVETIGFSPDETREAVGSLRTFLAGMEAAIGSGAFAPRVETRLRKDPCAFCECADVCGPGHEDRFRAKDDDPDPDARALRALRDLP